MESPKVLLSVSPGVWLLMLTRILEIAQAALFLASGRRCLRSDLTLGTHSSFTDDSSYVNGQNLAVDGGLTSSVPVVPGKFA